MFLCVLLQDLSQLVMDVRVGLSAELCSRWSNIDANKPALTDSAPCPCNTNQMSIQIGNQYESDPDCNPNNPVGCAIYHPGAYQCFRLINPRYI